MTAVVTTVADRCRRCYSCVRHCPSRAIRVQHGQAEVIEERCVACGRCLRACSRGAKRVVVDRPRVRSLLATGRAVAMIAPSFPAAFPELRPGQVIAAVRRLGFAAVCEVAFGADLVTREYARAFAAAPDRLTLTSACPAAVDYVRKYAPDLVPHLAPILSPMAALGKALRVRLRPGCHPVFVGPCAAKLREVSDPEVARWVDAATTFPDLRALFEEHGVAPAALADEDFDPPRALSGGAFPVPGGLVHAAGLPAGLFDSRVYSTSNAEGFIEVIGRLARRVSAGRLDELEARFFDLLYCQGCIGGPLLDGDESYLRRKERVVAYHRARQGAGDPAASRATLDALADLDLGRRHTPDPQPSAVPSEEEIRRILARTGKPRPEDELNCRACGYRSCRDKAIAVHQGLAEEDMCLPYLVERLQGAVANLDRSRRELTEAQAQLIRSERLASMGQLAAGIAHEVNNPLGTILLYANLLADAAAAEEPLREDAKMILAEARRCKGIVAGLLDFARQNRVNRTRFPVRELVEEALRLVRAGREAAGEPDGVRYVIDVPGDLPAAFLDRDQMLQVLTNLVRNAVEIMAGRGTVTVAAALSADGDELSLRVIDDGPGIPPAHLDKLFSPFFTTRPGGRGNGLGLPICYGIAKMHRGTITGRNNVPGPGATFELRLPATADEAPAPGKELAS